MFQTLCNFVLKLALCIFLSVLLTFNGNIKDHYYRNNIGSNVVKVLSTTAPSGGTGFHIETESGNIYILTNAHVCKLADAKGEVLVETANEKMVRKVIEVYDQHDLCRVEAMPDKEGLKLASSIRKGEDIIVVGHPGLRQLTLAHGEFIGLDVIDLINEQIQKEEECAGKWVVDPFFDRSFCAEAFVTGAISSPIYGGNSGSPVVNKFGNVVGVVFAGNRSQPNDGHMVPLDHIKSFLKGL
jgi:S1-C subfamily serine protease